MFWGGKTLPRSSILVDQIVVWVDLIQHGLENFWPQVQFVMLEILALEFDNSAIVLDVDYVRDHLDDEVDAIVNRPEKVEACHVAIWQGASENRVEELDNKQGYGKEVTVGG